MGPCGCGRPDPSCPLPSAPQYVDLRTRYSELTTLTSQYIKFISETLRRMEEEEVRSWGWRGPVCGPDTALGNPSESTQHSSPHCPAA